MSQLQFQSPGSPVPSSAPLQLAQPQPGFSIPSATGSLPSESASHPLRSSALPSASATPFCNPTGRCKYANTLREFFFTLKPYIKMGSITRCNYFMFTQAFRLCTFCSYFCLKPSYISLAQLDFALNFHNCSSLVRLEENVAVVLFSALSRAVELYTDQA